MPDPYGEVRFEGEWACLGKWKIEYCRETSVDGTYVSVSFCRQKLTQIMTHVNMKGVENEEAKIIAGVCGTDGGSLPAGAAGSTLGPRQQR